MARVGDVVLIPSLGDQHHVIIGQALKGYWVQNLVTGALPTRYRMLQAHPRALPVESSFGYMPKEMTVVGRSIEWSKS